MRRVPKAGLVAAACAAALGATVLAGCGSDEPEVVHVPAAAAPTLVPAATPARVGEVVSATDRTPASVRAALAAGDAVVVGILMPGVADDESVQEAIADLRGRTSAAGDVSIFTFTLDKPRAFGDLPDVLDIDGTPSVAVIGRDNTLVNLWRGLVDADLLAQSVDDARDRTPVARRSAAVADPLRGNAAGIALARRVRAAYRAVPGVAIESVTRGPDGTVRTSMRGALTAGRLMQATGRVTTGGHSAPLRLTPRGVLVRAGGASCWSLLPTGAGQAALRDVIDLHGVFSAPRRKGRDLVLRQVTRTADGGTQTAAFRIRAATAAVVSGRLVNGRQSTSMTVRHLTAAPRLPAASPRCS